MRRIAGLTFVLLFAACSDAGSPATPGTPQPARRAVGLIEITITGIGGAKPVATARSLPFSLDTDQPGGPGFRARALGMMAPRAFEPVPGNGIQLEPVSTASFITGTRGVDGFRYVSATYRVRNADQSGAAYTGARTNLTFIAVNQTSGTIGGSAISQLERFDGSAADPAIAMQMAPTGLSALDAGGRPHSLGADVLQVFTEAEAASIDLASLPTIASVLPYGFVVRENPLRSNRTLAASPAADVFNGVATFAYRYPLQGNATADPFTVSARFLAVDDDQAVVTESLEESDAAGGYAVAARTVALGAPLRSLFGRALDTLPVTRMCRVRSAGTAGSPLGFLVDSLPVVSLAPSPYADGANYVAANASLSATFSQAMSAANGGTFVVNGYQGGRAFLTQSYTGSGTNTLTTPAGSFFPGEMVEVSLTPGLNGTTAGAHACPPLVYRYRIASTASTAHYTTGTTLTAGVNPDGVTAGDVNGDGNLDLVNTNYGSGTVTVFLGNGAGSFSAAPGSPITVGTSPLVVVLGDFDGDGTLDFAVNIFSPAGVSVWLGNGDGSFTVHPHGIFALNQAAYNLATGDLNGDGWPDLVATTSNSTAQVLLNDRAGGFLPARGAPAATSEEPQGIALGDLNGDGNLDVVTANHELMTANNVSVLLGNGAGGLVPAPGSPLAMATGPLSVAVGDVDGDGDLDLVVTKRTPASYSVLLGNGTGTFTAFGGAVSVPSFPMHVALGDVDGDGKLDLAIAHQNADPSSVTIRLGNGAGAFAAAPGSPIILPGITRPRSIVLADFNNDGKLDFATANDAGGTLSVYLSP